MSSLEQLVEREIHDLHEFFVEWFAGQCANEESVFQGRFLERFSSSFFYIQPGGSTLTFETLQNRMRHAHGAPKDFAILIRNVRVRFTDVHGVVVTYEEWQRNARMSKPANNGRLSTALLKVDGSELRWQHLHETWLPPDVIAAADYNF